MRYSVEVKLFALKNRNEGKGWGEIRRAITEKFSVPAPTVRGMQKWEKETPKGLLDRALKEKARKEAETIKEQALTTVAEDLLPRLWKAREAGEDIEYLGWKWFFSIVESTIGSDKFRKFMERYLKEPKDTTIDASKEPENEQQRE